MNAFAQAPGCPNIVSGPDQSLTCQNNCTSLSATILETGSSSNYSVSAIPFSPPYPTTGGTPLFVGLDDIWGPITSLGFKFCFFNSLKNFVVAGANGLLTFDGSQANQDCEWSFTASCPAPGPPPGGLYNNSVMGAYHDIDPSQATGFGINYAILGNPPCRTFVLNYHQVPHFNANPIKTTQQIVLYETTNVIEVYIKDKPTWRNWNNGNAVIGIQNSNGSIGLSPPGRNTGPWTASNEAWRFTPDGPPNWTVTWTDHRGNVVGTGLTIHNVCPRNTTTYYAEVVYTNCDNTSIALTDSTVITMIDGFTATHTAIDEFCPGSCDGEVTFATTGGTAPFSFDIGNGPQASPTFTGLCTGTYFVAITDAHNCYETIEVTIAGPPPIVISMADTFICLGGTATITPVLSGGTAPYSYAWDNNTTHTTLTVSPVTNETHCLVITDDRGCSFPPVCVNVSLHPLLTVAPVADLTICTGNTTSLGATGTGGSGNYTFAWDQGLDTGQYHDIAPDTTTTYTVILTDDCGTPPDTGQVTISVVQPPEISFMADTTIGCAPLTIHFTSNGIPPGSVCVWELGDGGTSHICDAPSHTYLTGGFYDVSLTITSPAGCIVNETKTDYIFARKQPVAAFSAHPQPTTILDPRVYFTNQSSGALFYEWSIYDEDGLVTHHSQHTRHTFSGKNPAIYPVCLMAIDRFGCTDTVCNDVVIHDNVSVFVPNGFTPNNDGLNEVFTPVLSSHEVHEYAFLIFDRWGHTIFHSNTPGEGWDGTAGGKPVPNGVYAWKMNLIYDWNNRPGQFAGYVTVFR